MKQLKFQDMNDGEIIEEVNEAIEKIAENLMDAKTDQLKPRSVNCKLIFQRVINNQGIAKIAVSYQIENKICPRTEFIAKCDIDDGIIGMQPTLFPKEDDGLRVAK